MDRLRGSASLVTVALLVACGDASRSEDDPLTAGGSTGSDDGITSLTTVITTGASVDDGEASSTTEPRGDSTTGSVEDSSSDGTTGAPVGSTESSGGESTTGGSGLTIYEIQEGVVPTGSEVDITAVIVTAVGPSGLFVQEPGSGPYSGIFVFTGGMSGASIGDEVDVSGTTAEQDGLTEIVTGMGGAVNPTGGSGVVIAPEVVALAELADPRTAEPWEGVLVRVEGALTVEALPGFSEFDVGDGTDVVRIDDFVYDALADAGAFPELGIGAGFSAIQGPLHYTFAAFKIAPRAAADLEGYDGPPPPDWTAVNALDPGDLVITEIMYNPTCASDDCEWIEVWNATAGNVNLADLRIQDSALGQECTIGSDVIVPAGDYAWLSTDDAGGWPYAMQPDAFCTGAFPGFNNSGTDFAAILNATGILDQTAAYTASDTAIGRSWKLQPGSLSAAANDQAGNWCYSTAVFDMPGGTDEQGSPGAPNEAACAP
jgi:hypothetical protein